MRKSSLMDLRIIFFLKKEEVFFKIEQKNNSFLATENVGKFMCS